MDPRQPAPSATQRWALRALLLVGCALAVRAGLLATTPTTRPEPVAISAAPGRSHRVPEKPAPPKPTRRLSIDEYAALYGLCPTAVDELPPELLPERLAPPHRTVSLKKPLKEPTPQAAEPVAPRGRLTGVRIASRATGPSLGFASPRIAQTAEPADGWLVAPEKWFAPEDRPPIEPVGPEEPAESGEPVTEAPPAPIAVPPAAEPPVAEPPAAAEPAPALEAVPATDPETIPETTPWPVEPSPNDSPAYPATNAEPAPEPPAVAEPLRPEVESFEEETTERPIESPGDFGPSFAPPGVTTEPVPPAEPAAPESVAPPREANDESVVAEPFDPPAAVQPPRPAEPTKDWAETPFDTVVPPPADPPSTPWPREPLPQPEPAPPLDAPIELPEAESIPAPVVDPKPEAVPAPSPRPTRQPAAAQPPVAAPRGPDPKPKALFAAPGATRQPISTEGPTHPGGGEKAAAEAQAAAGGKSADESHRELFAKNNYPSAQECAACHQRIYDEWSVSSHAYAFVSPMFHRFEETITQLSQGTVGHFCQRCHSPVGTAMYEPRSTPIGHMAKAAQEGVTCIACHRVNQRWGKSNGDRRIVPGDLYAPVYGGVGGDGVAAAIADKAKYKVKTSPGAGSSGNGAPGQAIHTEGRFFDQLTKAEACTSCHQVAVHPGVKLEVVWEQYRASPACKKGVTCQDCHMGRVPGLAQGYNYGPIAELNGKTVNNHRKQSSHVFYGPGYSIAHPGIFPQHKDADKWSFDEWMLFDWRAGWGTDEFEEKIDEYEDNEIDTAKWFPPVWADTDDRADAREVVEDNLERLKTKRRYRELVMENGSKVDGPFFRSEPFVGQDLKFEYVVANQNEGHNLPTASLGAQPQLWANVVLIDPHGRRVWESGYTDSNGDLCDIHSVDVRHGRIPFDKQLFNLQTMFLITGATGTDREFYLPVNLDIDQVAHLRPGALPITVLNHPPFIRMESRSLAPLGKKRVKYTVPAELMRQPGKYRLSFRLRNRTEPMYFMRLCKSTPEMLRAMTEGTLDIHPQSVEFYVR